MILHADPAAVVPELLRHLPVKVQRVEVHAPSLEDVFLELTGRGLAGGPPSSTGERRGGGGGWS